MSQKTGGRIKKGNAPQPKQSEGTPRQAKSGQEYKENDVAKLISEIHEQIGCGQSEAARRDGVSLLVEIKNEIQTITHELREFSGQGIEANQTPAKQPEKKSDKRPAAQSSSRPTTVTLRTSVTNIKSALMKTNRDLTTSRRELRDSNDQVLNMYTALGLQPDTKSNDRDNLNADVKGIIRQVEQRNAELSEKLKLLDKTVASSHGGMEQQQHKGTNEKSKTDKKVNSKELNAEKKTLTGHVSDITTISSAVARISELQEYKSKMDGLALRVIHIGNQTETRQSQRTVNVTLSHFAEAIGEIEAYISTLKITTEPQLQLEKQTRELSKKLKLLEQAIMPSEMESQEDKRADGKSKKEKEKTTRQESNTVTYSHESNIAIISTAVRRFEELQEHKRDLIYKIIQVSHSAKGLEQFMTEKMNSSGTLSPEAKKTQKKTKNSKDHKNIQSTENNPPDSVNTEDEAVHDFQKHMNFLNESYNRMKEEIGQLKTSLKHLWNTATSASNHVRQVTEKKVDKQAQFEVENTGLHKNEEMHRFDQEVLYLVNKALNCTEEVHKIKREVDIMQKENDSLQQRLSKIAGDKLTVGNPDITNLADPNRPMKIGEWFSELYDNEWTDAMDLCHKKLGKKFEEDKILQAFYKTLMTCYMICDDKSTKSKEKARQYFQDASKELMVDAQEDEIMKQLIDNRKLAADSASKQLLKEIQDGKNPDATKLLKEIDNKILSVIQPTPYFSQCMTLCWKMVVQNPPLVLLGGPPQGKEFDKNKFREYTSSGKKVIFTVWPALYLHENGPLLVKGVVQVK